MAGEPWLLSESTSHGTLWGLSVLCAGVGAQHSLRQPMANQDESVKDRVLVPCSPTQTPRCGLQQPARAQSMSPRLHFQMGRERMRGFQQHLARKERGVKGVACGRGGCGNEAGAQTPTMLSRSC